MNVNRIDSTNFGAGIKVLARSNNRNKYLYNQVMDVVKNNHMSATFSNEGIDFPSATAKVISDLKNLGIKYMTKK